MHISKPDYKTSLSLSRIWSWKQMRSPFNMCSYKNGSHDFFGMRSRKSNESNMCFLQHFFCQNGRVLYMLHTLWWDTFHKIKSFPKIEQNVLEHHSRLENKQDVWVPLWEFSVIKNSIEWTFIFRSLHVLELEWAGWWNTFHNIKQHILKQ